VRLSRLGGVAFGGACVSPVLRGTAAGFAVRLVAGIPDTAGAALGTAVVLGTTVVTSMAVGATAAVAGAAVLRPVALVGGAAAVFVGRAAS